MVKAIRVSTSLLSLDYENRCNLKEVSKYVTFHREPKHFELSTAVTVRWFLHALTAGLISCHKLGDVITQFVLIWHVSQRASAVNFVSLKEI